MSDKRGLSPVIATMLLVALTLVLATIIFFWARSFIGEAIQKNGREISSSCESVAFRIEANTSKIAVENIGSIPIHAVEIKEKKIAGEIVEIDDFANLGLSAGQTKNVDTPVGLTSGNNIIVTPILLGEDATKKKAYVCDTSKYGVETSIK